MKKPVIKKEYIKPFICGCISTIVVLIILFLLYKLAIRIEDRQRIKNNNNNEINNNSVNINGIDYEYNELDSGKKCDEFNDIMYVHPMRNFFIKNNGDIYLLDTKKFSDTNQNCRLLSKDIKAKQVIDNYYIIGSDNKHYYIDYNNESKTLKQTNEKIDKELLNDDIKIAVTYEYNSDYESKKAYREYIVLKNDGKLYKYHYKGYYNESNYDFAYKLENQELLLETDGEYVKQFHISDVPEECFIITDKNIYTQTLINKECKDFNDIKCEYKYEKDELLNKYTNYNILNIRKYPGEYNIETYDKSISYTKKTNSMS